LEITYHLTSLGALLYICNEFLLTLLKLCALSIELALSLSESSLVLTEPFGGSDSPAKESFLG